eukprot:259735_1
MATEEQQQYPSRLVYIAGLDEKEPLSAKSNVDDEQSANIKPEDKPNGQAGQPPKPSENTPLNHNNNAIQNYGQTTVDVCIQNESCNITDEEITELLSSSPFRLYSCLNRLDRNDKYYTSFIQRLELGFFFDTFMLIPTVVYSFIGIAILVIIYAVLFRSILYLVNSVLCLMANEMIKRTIQRNRPNTDTIADRMVDLDGVLLVKRSSSMPSGDTAQATIFALTMIYTMNYYLSSTNNMWYCTALTIPFAGFGRVYLGKHWIGDTLCGAIEALLICLVVCSSIGP